MCWEIAVKEKRINARLDDESAEELEFIRRTTGATTITDALKYSISEVASRLRESESNGSKMKALLMSDFVGCASGPADLSENYKERLDADWATKHGIN